MEAADIDSTLNKLEAAKALFEHAFKKATEACQKAQEELGGLKPNCCNRYFRSKADRERHTDMFHAEVES